MDIRQTTAIRRETEKEAGLVSECNRRQISVLPALRAANDSSRPVGKILVGSVDSLAIQVRTVVLVCTDYMLAHPIF